MFEIRNSHFKLEVMISSTQEKSHKQSVLHPSHLGRFKPLEVPLVA
jgi:hypothetical protein